LHDENEDGPVDSLYEIIISEEDQIDMAIYFDDPANEAAARQLVASVVERRRTGPD
jgi:hypothetical protein